MSTLGRLGLWGALVATPALGGCATTASVTTAQQTDGPRESWTLHPEAMSIEGSDGKVQVAVRDGMQDLRIDVQNLRPAGAAFEGTAAYVVWVRPADGTVRRIGELRVDGHRRGRLAAPMPAYRAFEVLVTAEPHPQAARPAGSEVMETTVALPA